MITTQTPAELLAQADAIADRIKVFAAEFAELVEAAQDACPHPISSIREAPHERFSWGGCSRPFRVCIECGLAEEGWGIGYQRLGQGVYSGVASLSREDAAKLVRSKRP